MKALKRISLLLSVLVFQAHQSYAAGTTSAAFLRLGAGARASAMGDAFTSRADDASAPYWNPAGMSTLSSRELLAEHALHVQDISISRLFYVHPLGNSFPRPRAGEGVRRTGEGRSAIRNPKSAMVKSLGFSASHLSLSGIEARTGNTARPDYTFGASDFYGAVSYSHPLSHSSSLGFTGKVIQQKLDRNRAGSYAADVGFLQNVGRFNFGATVTNVGPSVKFIRDSYPLPQAVRGGVSFNARPVPLNLSFEAEKLRGEADLSYRLGMEFDLAGMLSFRMGYLTRPGATQRALKGTALGTVANSEFNQITGMVGGIGLRLFGYGLDYAFTPYGELGSTHKVSLSARF